MPPKHDINRLNTFLRGELSAVETYELALEKLATDPLTARALLACRDSHRRRAGMLQEAIRRIDGIPSEMSGIWGSFAKVVDRPARAFDREAAVEALERGEEFLRADYERRYDDLSPWLHSFIEGRLVPEQQRSLALVEELHARMLDGGLVRAGHR